MQISFRKNSLGETSKWHGAVMTSLSKTAKFKDILKYITSSERLSIQCNNHRRFYFSIIFILLATFLIQSNVFAMDTESLYKEYYRQRIAAPKTAAYQNTDIYKFGKNFCKTNNIRCSRYHMRYIENEDNILATYTGARDGGMLIVGTEKGKNARGMVFRFDQDKKIVWKKVFSKKGFPAIEGGAAIETKDGGFLVSMQAYVHPARMGKTWILKLDPNGHILWEKLYRGKGSKNTPHAGRLWLTENDQLKMKGHIYPKWNGPAMTWESALDQYGKVLYDRTKGKAYETKGKISLKYPYLVE